MMRFISPSSGHRQGHRWSVERYLLALLAHINVFEESAVGIVGLLLDRRSELEQLLRHRLVGTLEDVDKTARVRLVMLGKESDGLADLASTAGPANAVDIVLDGQGELKKCIPELATGFFSQNG